MITKCLWRGQPINCAAIFRMQPTDQGMCCSFNKEKAEEMFMEGRYKEHLINMIAQDENQAMGDSQLPEWWDTLLNYKFIQMILLMIQILAYLTKCYPRFDSAPEAGESRGLDLILDAHTDLITASSVTKPFQVMTNRLYIVKLTMCSSSCIIVCLNRGLMLWLTQRWNTLWSPWTRS